MFGIYIVQVRESPMCTAIVFTLWCRNPEQCPNVVSLLAESFNPHVRCGASWALGIACAASGNKVREGGGRERGGGERLHVAL